MNALDKCPGRSCHAAAISVIAGALAFTAAACGSTSLPAPAASPQAAVSPSASMTESAATIGTECGMIPRTGMGSVHVMTMDPVVTAASRNPLITTLAAEVKKARLTGVLNTAKDITVFAPDNAAFKKLTGHDMAMMDGMAELAKILKYHVVSARITPAELASGMTFKTLEGSRLQDLEDGQHLRGEQRRRGQATSRRPPCQW